MRQTGPSYRELSGFAVLHTIPKRTIRIRRHAGPVRKASSGRRLVSEDDTLPNLPLYSVSDADVRTTRAPATDDRFSVLLRGIRVDSVTRCAHYDGPRDVVAIRFSCCDAYYPCFECHREATGHEPVRWSSTRRDEPAVFCGVCGATMTAPDYLRGDHACPTCGTNFNPGCTAHHHHYFTFE